jgi:hypothetical protein
MPALAGKGPTRLLGWSQEPPHPTPGVPVIGLGPAPDLQVSSPSADEAARVEIGHDLIVVLVEVLEKSVSSHREEAAKAGGTSAVQVVLGDRRPNSTTNDNNVTAVLSPSLPGNGFSLCRLRPR